MEELSLSRERGFLPDPDPLLRMPSAFAPWEEVALDLPKLLAAGKIRAAIHRLPQLDASALGDERERRRAMLILSFLGHAYVWGEPEMTERLPSALAVLWYQVAKSLGRPPVLSYASYALDNWRRLDARQPIELGNIVLLQNFLGGMDEEWFVLVHVNIEARAGAALSAIMDARRAVAECHPEEVADHLSTIARTLEELSGILLRMPDSCDPYVYYHRVRPYLHGWGHSPALPNGILYEGVEEYRGSPQRFRGETGAQSSIVPSLDAALGIAHKEGPLHAYLMEMRDYMPPGHRAFIEQLETGPSIRNYVLREKSRTRLLRDAYNACIRELGRFRSTHLEYAERYIQKQSQSGPRNPVEIGTGGTPFIPYLRKHRDETEEHLIS